MRILLNPVFSIETGQLISHDGESFVEHVPIRCDRSAQNQSQQNATKANSVAGGFGATAGSIGSSLIPGLEREANNPVGLTPEQKNNALVTGSEAIGGVNSGVKGAAALDTARTRNAGGLAPALDEAARIKGRQQATNSLDVSNLDTSIANKKQQFAQGELGNLYQGANGDQLKAMGLSDEDINTMLKAGQSGWMQQAQGWLGTLSGAAANGAKAANGGGGG